MTHTQEIWHGVGAHRLESEVVSVVVLPTRGAKIASLVDQTGREWLAQPVAGELAPAECGARFAEAEMSGWDEMAPTVRSPGRPDHGEVWAVPWTVLHEDAAALEVEVEGRDSSYVLRRRLELTSTGLRLGYHVRAGALAVDFLWMAHPQFRADPGSTVIVPGPPRHLVTIDETAAHPSTWRSPALAPLAEVPVGAGCKVWCPPDSAPEQASLVHSDGASLTLAWDSRKVPFLAVWADHCRGSREPVIALEPSLGFGDDVDTASARGQVARLAPRTEIEWSLEVDLSPAPAVVPGGPHG